MKKQLVKICLVFLSLIPAGGLLLYADDSNSYLKSVEMSYQAGEYNRFLKSLDEEYRKAGKAGMLSTVFKELKKWNSVNEADLFQDFRVKEICGEHSDDEICKKIDAVASLSLSDKQIEAVKFINSLKNRMPDKKSNTPENKLVAIQAEYDLKATLLKLALARKDKQAVLDAKKKIVLTLEKFKKMEEAAAQFEDPKWKSLVQTAKEAFVNSYEARSEFAYLKDLAAGKVTPKNETEEKIRERVKDFLAHVDGK
ncbi:MAG TPA: hypothetical protein VLG76_06980 [Rhabdochlamydiaceae bacterium]|nr:hypothetical protein [Rhabdochlamydiaceae bacterium]